jgi:hypothetical protein
MPDAAESPQDEPPGGEGRVLALLEGYLSPRLMDSPRTAELLRRLRRMAMQKSSVRRDAGGPGPGNARARFNAGAEGHTTGQG